MVCILRFLLTEQIDLNPEKRQVSIDCVALKVHQHTSYTWHKMIYGIDDSSYFPFNPEKAP